MKRQITTCLLVASLLVTTPLSYASMDLNGSTLLKQSDSFFQSSWTLRINHETKIECGPFGSRVKSLGNCELNYSYTQTKSGSGGVQDRLFQVLLFDSSNREIRHLGGGYESISSGSGSGKIRFELENSMSVKLGPKLSGTGGLWPTEIVSQTPIDVTVISQAEADRRKREETAKREAFEKAELAKKLLTIDCYRGNAKRAITAENPKCPKGWKNPYEKYPTFRAYASCKLFKKDYRDSRVYLQDRGKTLTLLGASKYENVIDPIFNSVKTSDLVCTLASTSAPSYVIGQIDSTRALDGIQRAKWGSLEAFWTYHPDNGLDISFYYRGK